LLSIRRLRSPLGRVFLASANAPVEPTLGHVDSIVLQMRPKHSDLVSEMLYAFADRVDTILHPSLRRVSRLAGLICYALIRDALIELHVRHGKNRAGRRRWQYAICCQYAEFGVS
jgi:hypothetical protein